MLSRVESSLFFILEKALFNEDCEGNKKIKEGKNFIRERGEYRQAAHGKTWQQHEPKMNRMLTKNLALKKEKKEGKYVEKCFCFVRREEKKFPDFLLSNRLVHQKRLTKKKGTANKKRRSLVVVFHSIQG